MKVACRRVRLAVMIVAPIAFGSSPGLADMTKDQCIDANGKAQDLRREGKLTEASEQLRQCTSPGCPAMVRDDCARRLDELDRVQPTLVFDAKDGAGRDLTAVKVTVDGRLLAENLNGGALAVDPGAHTFTFEVAGQSPVVQQFVMHEGEKGRSERIAMGPAVASTPPTVALPTASGTPGQPSVSSPQVTRSGPNMMKRTVGFITGGVGVGLLGLAAYYEATAFSRDHDSKDAARSPDPNVRATTSTIYAQAVQAQTFAYVFGGIGLGALATGVVLLLTSGARAPEAPSGVRVVPTFGPGVGAIEVSDAW